MNKHFRSSRRPFIPFMVLAAVTIAGFVIMALWNALMPDIFKLPEITFWQALGLFILSRLLIGGFGGRPGRRPKHRNRRKEFVHHMRERWQHMSPEQREKFRQKLKNRWDIDFVDDTPEKPEE